MLGKTAGAPLWAGRTLAFTGIVLVAVNLRTAVGALSPLFADIGADIPLNSVGVGLLGTLPPLCFGLFGLLAPALRQFARTESLLVLALVAMTVGHVLRAVSVSYPMLALASTLTFAALGVGNVVLPPVVKEYFPDRVGLLTSLYATVMTLFSLIPPLVAVPVADALGWRVSVGMWASFCVLALVPWLMLWLRDRGSALHVATQERGARGGAPDVPTLDRSVDPSAAVSPEVIGRVWRSLLAWALAILFGMTAMNVFAVFAWLPEILRDTAGMQPGEAGALLSLYAAVGVPISLIVPILATRLRSVRPLIVAGATAYVLGYAGLAIAPASATWLWVVLAGLGPLLFPLTLVLINLRTRTAAGSVALSGFTQGIGYLVGALGPLIVGILHQLTDTWTAPILFLLATVIVIAATGAIVARPRVLEDDWHAAERRPCPQGAP